MLKSEDCVILGLDTAEKVVEITGMKLEEVSEIYRKNLYQGNSQVYWQRDDVWFGLTVDNTFIHPSAVPGLRIIDEAVLEILDNHSRMKLPT